MAIKCSLLNLDTNQSLPIIIIMTGYRENLNFHLRGSMNKLKVIINRLNLQQLVCGSGCNGHLACMSSHLSTSAQASSLFRLWIRIMFPMSSAFSSCPSQCQPWGGRGARGRGGAGGGGGGRTGRGGRGGG